MENRINSVKLSTLQDDAELMIGDYLVLDKKCFLQEIQEHKGQPVYTTREYSAHIDAKSMLDRAIECEADNMYEDWRYDVANDITDKDILELQHIVDKILNRVDIVTYKADKKVEIDVREMED